MLYARSVWDPTLIITQIVVTQASFYVAIGFILYMGSLLLGSDLSLTAVLDPSALTLRHRLGWPPIVAYLMVAPAMSVVMLFVVMRARKCLDFGATLYGYHLLLCWLYAGFPRNWEWWVVNLVSMTVTIVLAEHLCQRKELEDIPVSYILGRGSRSPSPPPRPAASPSSAPVVTGGAPSSSSSSSANASSSGSGVTSRGSAIAPRPVLNITTGLGAASSRTIASLSSPSASSSAAATAGTAPASPFSSISAASLPGSPPVPAALSLLSQALVRPAAGAGSRRNSFSDSSNVSNGMAMGPPGATGGTGVLEMV